MKQTKVWISHDVDHISVLEHWKDLIVPKFCVRTGIEYLSRNTSMREVLGRTKSLILNRWERIEELAEYDKNNGIKPTFFVGVANGLGLSYSQSQAKWAIRRILDLGCDVGVHGIAFDNPTAIKEEATTFQRLSGLDQFGIRMHYLRRTKRTAQFLSDAGYLFDATEVSDKGAYAEENGLKVVPLHIMDGWFLHPEKRYQHVSLSAAKDLTLSRMRDLHSKDLGLLSLNFHDRNFSPEFSKWQEWYKWCIQEIAAKKQNVFVSIESVLNDVK